MLGNRGPGSLAESLASKNEPLVRIGTWGSGKGNRMMTWKIVKNGTAHVSRRESSLREHLADFHATAVGVKRGAAALSRLQRGQAVPMA